MNFIFEKVSIICDELNKLRVSKYTELNDFTYTPCEYKEKEQLPVNLKFMPYKKGDRVGGADSHYWFHTTLKTPTPIDNKQISIHFETGSDGTWDAKNPQALVYLNGKTTQGLDINHRDVLLDYDTGYDLYVYFYTCMVDIQTEFKASLELTDVKIEKLYYHLKVALDSAACQQPSGDNYIKIMKHLEAAVNLIDFRVPLSEDFYKSVDLAIDYMDREFYNGACKDVDITVSCIGHTHIDVAWLWTLAQTREKAQRTFATVINLMKQYPEYKFMSSQPQLYKYIKDTAPDLYEEIKKAIKDGRWEVEGAMWLEADCNLISGESLVRQILLGKKFIKDEFGIDSRVLWLPDVFGYSAALPQILKKSGVDKFVTSKISWNEFNKLPYDTFMWEGIDGTEIFTYFLTAQDLKEGEEPKVKTTYVAYTRPNQIYGTWKRYQPKEFNNEALITFGFGDGGGGPTKDMLEQQRRMSHGIPGIPQTKMEFAGDFLNRIEKKFFENCKTLRRTPRWVGELYLELHRGTYTSIAKNKKNNRISELLYQKAETASVMDNVLLNGSYPQEQINESWHTILLNQFHDIIPGSSIFEVYEDSDKDYARILEKGREIFIQKLNHISANIKTAGGTLVYNPNAFTASGTVNVNGKCAYVSDIPSMGYKVVKTVSDAAKITVGENGMENKFFRIELNEKGELKSVFDKRNGREVVKPDEAANRLEVFEDFPKFYDAWEISPYYKSKMWTVDELVSKEIVYDGARTGIKTVKRFLQSTICQTMYLYSDIDRIDFDTVIDWKQEHLLLKAAFPIDVHASEATYEIQFGHLKRPTHQNTSWEAAKFEVCAHKWADIGDGDYGVSLINNCKYGHSAEGSTLKLSLLKSATYPNPAADKEIHEFTYSLYPHKGSFKESDTIKHAYLLNQPLCGIEIGEQDGTLNEEFSLVSCDSKNIIIETVKQAEESDDIIVRLYEACDRRTDAALNFGFDISKAYICDMLEHELEELKIENNTVKLTIHNFEIITLKLKR